MNRYALWSELKRLGNPGLLRYISSSNAQLQEEITRLNIIEARRMHGLDDEDDQEDDYGIAAMLDQAAVIPQVEVKFHELKDMKTRIYYINGNWHLTDTQILNTIQSRLGHALNTGISPRSHFLVQITTKHMSDDGEVEYRTQSFRALDLDEFKSFEHMWETYLEKVVKGGSDGRLSISKIKITVVRENGGGCYKGGQDKKERIGEVICINPRSANNNCFFACIKDFMGPEQARRYNIIRKEFGLLPNAEIPISIGLAIFKKYRTDPNQQLEIFEAATMRRHTTGVGSFPHAEKTVGPAHCICLEGNHYTIRVSSLEQQCPDCLKKYFNTHNCDINRVKFAQAQILRKGRYMLSSMKPAKSINNGDVIHYDLETHRVPVGGKTIQQAYIVGFNDGDEFHYFAGDTCIDQFLDYLLALKRDVIVNAYNGANFDHYFISKALIKRGLKASMIINNGSIISMKYQNLTFFDLCKHLQGSLKANLQALKCSVQKGDFDHELASRWEDMSVELRADCLKYLEGDVMGLRELYNKVNASIYEKYRVNITSYISTSSLTFNAWKKSVANEMIMLPTMDQEQAFRQAIRGGRTYKSKHRFISSQRDAYLNGEIKFDDITDYVIDADVVSLYPTAMSKFMYPVGQCQKLREDEHEMKGVMGIYHISYTPNKNLAHGIGGRRDETGRLHWDLKESSGWYSSIDIEDMLANGYEVIINSGYYWTKQAPIFTKYIEELFQAKAQAEKGTATYTLAKLFMNALYGKTIQRPIYTKTELIQTNEQYWQFWAHHVINELTPVGDSGMFHVSGTPRDILKQEKCISKPTQLGVFILAYSRRIMLGYMKEANPHFDSIDKKAQTENDIFYTDTDSLQMHARNAKMISSLGNKDLGGITDDLGDARILRGLWIAPKLYMLEYVKRGDVKPHYHFRGKGLSSDSLTVAAFEEMDGGGSLTSVRPFQMTRVHIKRNGMQRDIDQFSILYREDVSKTVNTVQWAGRRFEGNNSYPWV